MDIVTLILVIFVVFIIVSVCVSCCKKNKEGTVYGVAQGTIPAPVVDQSNPPPPAFNAMPPVNPMGPSYPAAQIFYPPAPPGGIAPYPSATPYPPATGGYQNTAPYPIAGPGAAYPPMGGHPLPPEQQLPPSYAEAVNQPLPPVSSTTNEVYAKQSPYNPNYQ